MSLPESFLLTNYSWLNFRQGLWLLGDRTGVYVQLKPSYAIALQPTHYHAILSSHIKHWCGKVGLI
jgi:hypothetical protein